MSVRRHVRPVRNYYLVHVSEYNETRSTWSVAKTFVYNKELEPVVHGALDLAYSINVGGALA